MKATLFYVGTFLGVCATVAAVVYGMRLLSNVTTPLTLHTPKPGITCAAMVTADGAALSCWRD